MNVQAAAESSLRLQENVETGSERLVPIGYVRSRFGKRNGIPVKRGVSKIEILDRFVPGLKGLRNSSHVIVLGHLHLAERNDLRASPRSTAGGEDDTGIFSVRSPARPNPIGYTVVKLLGREEGMLMVEGLDFIDGTPVVDVKPYSPGWDSIHAATRTRRIPFHEIDPAKALDLLVRDAVNFSGGLDHDGALAVLMVFVLATRYRVDPRNPDLKVEVNRHGTALDALIGMCGATFGSGRIRVEAGDEDSLLCGFDAEEIDLVMGVKEGAPPTLQVSPEAAEAWIEVVQS